MPVNPRIMAALLNDGDLVAMKTQGGNNPLGGPPEGAGFNRHQGALKAIWNDERIHVVCSEMKNVQQARENAEAARQGRLGWIEGQQLREYAVDKLA